ncbi:MULTISPECIES: AAA-like domain-containing protein [unclassified Microcystis]|uniref:AAA-like domain-containing protein n=1 Tax=unclassified Microcystis TaxID=2643300 RepID=UPI00258AB34A|nr:MULTISPECIES: AAA-like domain-containing protein [unclassified Microcystis]MCA2763034.1 AAA-like domain-containing protein [Microcystis sp. M151S2]MCA2643954.1 AAA-like domain-containing protein [Microcystis sp. M087S2]MCA2671204.1 AAA-like domain-containing protein [Microcystis sp. M080S2]MCA2689454.1 AAA-like domain-containing protein [Microcystis sp. M037S2]MCA2733395.1 AAA-like domain-containing protein [Microcystis sp. M158S2]
MYIMRPADQALYERLSHGDDCLVLSPPKTGKSSLLERTRLHLENNGVKCVSVLMTKNQGGNLRTRSSEKDFYWEFIHDLAEQFTTQNGNQLSHDQDYQAARLSTNISNDQILKYFIENILLEKVQDTRIVIFIDELEYLLNQEPYFPAFSHHFLQTLLYCYNQRNSRVANNQNFQRITFAFFGEKNSLSLNEHSQYNRIFDPNTQIEIGDFTLDDLSQWQGFKHYSARVDRLKNLEKALQEVLYWTNGQPLLTNKFLQLFFDSNDFTLPWITEDIAKDCIANIANERISGVREISEYLNNIREMLNRVC